MAVSGVKLAVGTAISRGNVVAQGDFSLTFNKEVLYDTTIDGIVYIHSNNASITAYTPATAVVDGVNTQQFQLNPGAWMVGPTQGVDTRPNATYNAAKITALPVVPNPGDSVLLEKAAPMITGRPAASQIRSGVTAAWGAFQFTNAINAKGRLSGPIGWYITKSATTYAVDIDTKVAFLPSLTIPAAHIPISDVLARIDTSFGMAPLMMADASGSGYEAQIPQSVMNGVSVTANNNYGEYVGILMGAAGNHLVGNEATTAQKRQLLLRMANIGKDIIENGRATGNAITENGGHNSWQWIPALCYLWVRNLNNDIDNMRTLCPGNILSQPFYWTSDLVAQLSPHNDNTKICISRRRVISAVAGTSISYPVVSGPDPARFSPVGLVMVRESDGATANILSVIETSTGVTPQVATIDAQPAVPFAVGDTIYMRAAYTINVGDPDWRVNNSNSQINPSPVQPYRDQQKWLEEVLFPYALGIWRSDWNVMRDYVLRCIPPSNIAGYPAPWGPRSVYNYNGNAINFDKAMWDAHAQSLGIIP